MKTINIILFSMFIFSGCSYTNPTYEVFAKRYANFQVGKSFIPNNFGTGNRKIYSENRYIYQNILKGVLLDF